MSEEIKDIEQQSSIVSEHAAEIAYDSQTVEVSAADLGISDSWDPGIGPYSMDELKMMLGHRHQLFHGQATVLKHVHVTSHCVAGYLKGTADTLYPHSRRIAAENVLNLTNHFVFYLIADQDDTQKYKKSCQIQFRQGSVLF